MLSFTYPASKKQSKIGFDEATPSELTAGLKASIGLRRCLERPK
jgi:hypothetical protein